MSIWDRRRRDESYGERLRHAAPFLATAAIALIILATVFDWPGFACVVLFGCAASVTGGFVAGSILPSIRCATGLCATIIMIDQLPYMMGLNQPLTTGIDITPLFEWMRHVPASALLVYALALWLNAIAHYMRWIEDEKGPPLIL